MLLDQVSRAVEHRRSRRPLRTGFGRIHPGLFHWDSSTGRFRNLLGSIKESASRSDPPTETCLDGQSPVPVQSTGAESMTESCPRCTEVQSGGGGRKCIRVPERRADESRSHSRRCSTIAFHSGPASAGYAMSGRSILHTYSSRRKWLERRWRPEGLTVSEAISTMGYCWAGYAGGRLSGLNPEFPTNVKRVIHRRLYCTWCQRASNRLVPERGS